LTKPKRQFVTCPAPPYPSEPGGAGGVPPPNCSRAHGECPPPARKTTRPLKKTNIVLQTRAGWFGLKSAKWGRYIKPVAPMGIVISMPAGGREELAIG